MKLLFQSNTMLRARLQMLVVSIQYISYHHSLSRYRPLDVVANSHSKVCEVKLFHMHARAVKLELPPGTASRPTWTKSRNQHENERIDNADHHGSVEERSLRLLCSWYLDTLFSYILCLLALSLLLIPINHAESSPKEQSQSMLALIRCAFVRHSTTLHRGTRPRHQCCPVAAMCRCLRPFQVASGFCSPKAW